MKPPPIGIPEPPAELPAALTSTEFVCETWGSGETALRRYAPLTRDDDSGCLCLHPTLAREYSWKAITVRATKIWSASGSLWNPRDFRLIYQRPA